jgi:hypothetical protein
MIAYLTDESIEKVIQRKTFVCSLFINYHDLFSTYYVCERMLFTVTTQKIGENLFEITFLSNVIEARQK